MGKQYGTWYRGYKAPAEAITYLAQEMSKNNLSLSSLGNQLVFKYEYKPAHEYTRDNDAYTAIKVEYK